MFSYALEINLEQKYNSGLSIFQCSLVDRARKTVRGSADDIGWLQRVQSLPSTEDGTTRFLEILDSVRLEKITDQISVCTACKECFL